MTQDQDTVEIVQACPVAHLREQASLYLFRAETCSDDMIDEFTDRAEYYKQAADEIEPIMARLSHSSTPSGEVLPYLVWSNEHAAWWGPDKCGYTRRIERAGRYERSEALLIAGTRDGGWRVSKGNPDEIAIPEQDAIDQYAVITAALSEQGKA